MPFKEQYRPPPEPTIWYWFDNTWPQDKPELKLAVLDAIALWNMSNETQGFNQLRLAEATDPSQLPSLGFSNEVPPTVQEHPDYATAVGEMVAVELYSSPAGRLKQMQIYITTDPRLLDQTPRMYRKVALHELGHVFGLDENRHFSRLKWLQDLDDPRVPAYQRGYVYGKSGSSVMNYLSDRGDHQGFTPERFVTPCDSRRAKARFLEQ